MNKSSGNWNIKFYINTLIFNVLFMPSFLQSQTMKTMLKLPDTGQSTSFTNTFGEDHDYTINPPFYKNNGNGTITDTITGLMWQQGDSGEMSYENALIYVDSLTLGGFTDWRLPNTYEAYSILIHQNANPAINTTFFTKTGAEYWWTADVQVNDATRQWLTNGGGGIGNHKKSEALSAGGTKKIHVRAVRDRNIPTTITQRYLNNGNGTITDNLTGLVWQKVPNTNALTWEDALNYAENLSLAGENNWRLPNIKELQTLAEVSLTNPCINTNFFAVSGAKKYWSSTSLPNQTTKAWYLDTQFGITTYDLKSVPYYVICVSGGTQKTTNIADIYTPNISIFPNPSFGTIHLQSDIKIEQLEIFDLLGKMVLSKNNLENDTTIFMDKKGLYWMNIRFENQVITKMIVIQ